MSNFRAKCRIIALVVLSLWVSLGALYGLLKPVPNGCAMTYMYPTYIPISAPPNVSSERYGLFLYHEGWKKIDFKEHLKKLSGVPVLFIPGNGGSYKQVRSLAAESERAYRGGPLEPTFYQDASLTPDELGSNVLDDADGFSPPSQYASVLDWFAVDLEGEHSAMDGRILEEHTEYVVYSINKILDQYQESHDARIKEGGETSMNLPRSVILVGHSMGGFVARAAVVHAHLRRSAVETILTLSSPHQLPPVALQPSLGHFFSKVNAEWRKRYEVQTTHTGRQSAQSLSSVVVISVAGGIHDYQIRTSLASLDGIIPPSHGFMISSTGMKNVWLSMDHQSILWCNQLVVQISHTLLSLIDSKTGHPFLSAQKRLNVFAKMLRSGLPQSFKWMGQLPLSLVSQHSSFEVGKSIVGSKILSSSTCPKSVSWAEDNLDKDLYILGTTVSVLAMDGRRRWLDIKKLGSNGKSHFIFVTNLAPCSGVRIHLWPEKWKMSSEVEAPPSRRLLEVTSKMVNIPAGPAPRQIEPGSQTEQAPPSAVLQLGPEDMLGYRFLTISVAPRPTISGRPPPAASMAVGQFFNPQDGKKELSPISLLLSSYIQEEIILKEDHPLPLNMSFSISLGLLPIILSIRTAGCGIKSSGLPIEEAGDTEHSNICKLRCFPPVAFIWDTTSGLHVIQNLYSDTIIVDSASVFWGSNYGSGTTTLLLMVDPHCSYEIDVAVSVAAAAGRFLLTYCSQIIGLTIAVIFFALMRQANLWELDLPIPSMLTALETNLRMPRAFLVFAIGPIFLSWVLSMLIGKPIPTFPSFIILSVVCYSIANGFSIVLILSSQLVFYIAATAQVLIKLRWQVWKENFHNLQHLMSLFYVFSSHRVIQILLGNSTIVVALVTTILVCLVHPALGLTIVFLAHASNCHSALCSFLAASFRSHVQRKESHEFESEDGAPWQSRNKSAHLFSGNLSLDENPSNGLELSRSYGETQLEVFHYSHGMLVLHLLAALMFVPSLVTWLQRIGMGHKFPWFVDSALCIGVILHSLCARKPGAFLHLGVRCLVVRLSYVYFIAGYYCYLCAISLVPYKALYAMCLVGILVFGSKAIEKKNREKGESYLSSRKHSHRH